MARIAIIGASGKTGRHVTQLAIDADHDVVAFARKPESFPVSGDRLEVVKGDVMDPPTLATLDLGGVDHIVVALGSRDLWGNTVRSEGTANVLDVLPAGASSPRIWVVSAAGVGDSWAQLGWSSKFFARVLLPSVMKEHLKQEEAVRASGRPYSILRASGLTNGDGTDYVVVDEGTLPTTKIPRIAVARCIVDSLEDDDWLESARSVTSRP